MKQLQQRVDLDNASLAADSAEGSSVVQTEYNFTLKRFLLDTESVVDKASEASPQEDLASTSQAESNVTRTPAGHFAETFHLPHEPRGLEDSTYDRRLTVSAEKRNDESLNVAVVDSEGEEYICARYGCILPSILEEFRSQLQVRILNDATSYLVPMIQLSTNIGAMTYTFPVSRELLSRVHLLGFQADDLTTASASQDARYMEARVDHVAGSHSELNFRAGDVIRLQDGNPKRGSLGGLTEVYPSNSVRPCTFATTESLRLIEALEGKPILNAATSRLLQDTMSKSPQGAISFLFSPSLIQTLDWVHGWQD